MDPETGRTSGGMEESRVDRQWNTLARALGYPGAAELLRATRSLPGQELAGLLGVTVGQLTRVRQRLARPATLPPEELARVPRGRQPARDGHLLCLECGAYPRTLSFHVGNGHGITEHDYMVRHWLPAKTRFRDLNPDEADALRPRTPAQLGQADTARADLRTRLAARAPATVTWSPATSRSFTAERTDRLWNEIAADLGYTDTSELLRLTRALNNDELSRILNVTNGQVAAVRQLRDRPDGVPPAELARVPRGRQPAVKGYLLCLECGLYFRSLARHLETRYGLAPDRYRHQHALAPETLLSDLGPEDEHAVLPPRVAADPERVSRARAIAREDLLDRVAARGPGPGAAPESPGGPPGADLMLNALGTHEAKALTYLAMRPETPYGQEALHRLFLGIQGPDPEFPGTPDLPRGYCALDLGPAGLTRHVRDDRGELLYIRPGGGDVPAALAGHLLAAAETHPAGLARIFGRNVLALTGRRSPVRLPDYRLALLRLLTADDGDGELTPAGVARSLRLHPNQARAMLQSFADAGLIGYHLAASHSPGLSYLVPAPLRDQAADHADAERAVVAYLNGRLAAHDGPGPFMIPLQDIEEHLRTLSRWHNRPIVPARSVMARLVSRDEIPAPARVAPPQTRVTVTEEQYAFARLLVTGIDRITAGDPAAVRDSAEQARTILADPSRVRALLTKGYGAST